MIIDKYHAKRFLFSYLFIFPGVNLAVFFLVIVPFFMKIEAQLLITGAIITLLLGFVLGIHLTYRSSLSLRAAIFINIYGFIFFSVAFVCGSFTWLTRIFSRDWSLSISVLGISLFIMALSVLWGMYLEAVRLKLWNKETADGWRKELGKYVNTYSGRVKCHADVSQGMDINDFFFEHGSIILGAFIFGPLMGRLAVHLFYPSWGNAFTIFSGGLFFAGMFICVNVIKVGPSLLRLFLLSKIQKEQGVRLINEDLSEIQKIRKRFFLSSWFMRN